MPVDPRVLAAIANPTGGRMTDIGQAYVRAKNVTERTQIDRESLEIKRMLADANLDQAEMDLFKDETKAVYGATSAYLEDVQNNPDLATDPQLYEQYMNTLTEGMPEGVVNNFKGMLPPQIAELNRKSGLLMSAMQDTTSTADSFGDFEKIPGTELYGQKSRKTGKYVNIKNMDADSGVGSEFERHLEYLRKNNLITRSEYNKRRNQRAEGFAGEMTNAQREKHTEKQVDRYNRETKDLRKEYSKGSEHFRSMGENISGAIAAIDSSDTRLSDIMLNQVLSQVNDTDVRAFQMYGEFDKEFGNLAQRISGMISKFFTGTRTEREKKDIMTTLKKFNVDYVQPGQKKLRNRYRQIAINQEKDPFDVVPPKNPEDIRDTKLLSKEQKIEMIRKYFPSWKP